MNPDRVRVFADANVLFSVSYRPEHEFLLFWASLKAEMVTSSYAADEARRNIIDPAHLDRLEQLLSRTVITYSEEQREHDEIHPPEKDRPILSGALNAQCGFLVSGDKRHFREYFGKSFRTSYGFLTIIEPRALLRLLRECKASDRKPLE